MAERWQTYQRF